MNSTGNPNSDDLKRYLEEMANKPHKQYGHGTFNHDRDDVINTDLLNSPFTLLRETNVLI